MLRLGAERDVLHVVADQRGCPTAAVDVAMALRTLVHRGARGGSLPSGTWNLCSPTPATWHELAEAVFTLARPTWRHRPTVHAITTAEWPTPAKRPADTRLDCTATMRDLGISCRPWREALPEVVAALLGDESCSVPPTTPRQEPA